MPCPDPSRPASSAARVGYVLKMYPRFSETFIVNELLALEAAGTDVEVVSLRPPSDGRFHESLAEELLAGDVVRPLPAPVRAVQGVGRAA